MTDFAGLLATAEKVVVLSGAGMSTAAGIPDYRGPNGLWTRNPQAARLFDIDAYRADRSVRIAAWQLRMASEIRTAQPGSGHRALAMWEHADRRVTIATQNIDGLHQRAGSRTVLELHGTFWEYQCLACGARGPIADAFDRVAAGEPDPDCQKCGGILRTATIAFGQALDARVLQAAFDAAADCDLLVAIGTTLAVQPAASLCDVAVSAGADLVIINDQPTGYDDQARIVARTSIEPFLASVNEELARRVG